MPFGDGEFDAAFFVPLLHLVEDWAGTVREMGRLTRGPVAAVITSRTPDLRQTYLEVRTELGFPTDRLDSGVATLVELLAPERTFGTSTARRKVDAEQFLAAIEPPEPGPSGMHAGALKRLRRTFGSDQVECL